MKKSPQAKGRLYEKRLQKQGMKLNPGSGNQRRRKGDGIHGEFLVEAKHTEAQQYILKEELLKTHTKYAREKLLSPAIRIMFEQSQTEYIVIEASWLDYINQKLEEDNSGEEEKER